MTKRVRNATAAPYAGDGESGKARRREALRCIELVKYMFKYL